MRVVKSISLPIDLAQKAEEYPNFSEFVQNCLHHGAKANSARSERTLKTVRQKLFEAEDVIGQIIDAYHNIRNHKARLIKIRDLLEEGGWVE
jgi:hypothetical protein